MRPLVIRIRCLGREANRFWPCRDELCVNPFVSERYWHAYIFRRMETVRAMWIPSWWIYWTGKKCIGRFKDIRLIGNGLLVRNMRPNKVLPFASLSGLNIDYAFFSLNRTCYHSPQIHFLCPSKPAGERIRFHELILFNGICFKLWKLVIKLNIGLSFNQNGDLPKMRIGIASQSNMALP